MSDGAGSVSTATVLLGDAMACAVETIRGASSIVLACHVNPDGDALGSMLAMLHVMRAEGIPVVASFPPPFTVAPHYRLLPGLELLTHPSEVSREPDVMITFDCGSIDRLGDLGPVAKSARSLIVIDHHISNDCYGTINVIDADAAASGVVTRRLVSALGLSLNEPAAVCLYATLVCDTGRFQYDATTSAVFDLASELLHFDVPVAPLNRALFEEHRFAYLRLAGEALAAAVLVPEEHFIYAVVTQEMLARHDVGIDEAEGLIDLVRRASEAEVSCVLKEDLDGTVRVSLRSLGAVDVCQVATMQGGGGHRFAAGFTSAAGMDSVISQIRAAIA